MTESTAEPVTQDELDRAAGQRDRAPAAYQEALAAFNRENPAPPSSWPPGTRPRNGTAAARPRLRPTSSGSTGRAADTAVSSAARSSSATTSAHDRNP